MSMTTLVAALQSAGVPLGAGLSETELLDAEARFSFRFPADLRRLLSLALPLGDGFPEWRNGRPRELRRRISAGFDVVIADVLGERRFWLREWGLRPSDRRRRRDAARIALRSVPVPVPLFGHRYLPSQPAEGGAPVMSLVPGDSIWFATNVAAYFTPRPDTYSVDGGEGALVHAPFWSEFVNWSSRMHA